MLFLTIEGCKIVSRLEKSFGAESAKHTGRLTTPHRNDNPSHPQHREKADVVEGFITDALTHNARLDNKHIRSQSIGIWLGDMRDLSSMFYSWGAVSSAEYLLPDPHYILAKGYQDMSHSSVPWHAKKDILFWRGGLSRPLRFWSADCQDYPRYQLVKQLSAYPACDVKLSYADYALIMGPCFAETSATLYEQAACNDFISLRRLIRSRMLYYLGCQKLNQTFINRSIGVKREQLLQEFLMLLDSECLVAKPIPMTEWGKYKYTIDIDGFGPSWKLFPCLAQGMVIFKVDSECNQFASSSIKPYQHYIPVQANLCDLVKQIDWARRHPCLCEEISNNAIKLARGRLSYREALISFVSTLSDI